jgi:hypothetical protein
VNDAPAQRRLSCARGAGVKSAGRASARADGGWASREGTRACSRMETAQYMTARASPLVRQCAHVSADLRRRQWTGSSVEMNVQSGMAEPKSGGGIEPTGPCRAQRFLGSPGPESRGPSAREPRGHNGHGRGSLAFAPVRSVVRMTCKPGLSANGSEQVRTLLPLAMQKVEGSSPFVRS